MEKLTFTTEDGESLEFFVEEQTRVNGTAYLLVADSEDGEANAYIMKDISADGDEVANYVFVDDDVEREAIAGVFSQMLEDYEIEQNP